MSCSRKWMSGPAQAWALLAMDRLRHIVALCFGPVTALRETLPPSAGRGMLSLDRPLSWMSPFALWQRPRRRHSCPAAEFRGFLPASQCRPLRLAQRCPLPHCRPPHHPAYRASTPQLGFHPGLIQSCRLWFRKWQMNGVGWSLGVD